MTPRDVSNTIFGLSDSPFEFAPNGLVDNSKRFHESENERKIMRSVFLCSLHSSAATAPAVQSRVTRDGQECEPVN